MKLPTNAKEWDSEATEVEANGGIALMAAICPDCYGVMVTELWDLARGAKYCKCPNQSHPNELEIQEILLGHYSIEVGRIKFANGTLVE